MITRNYVCLISSILIALVLLAGLMAYIRPDISVRRAISSGDLDGIRKYLKNGGDPNMRFTLALAGDKSKQGLLHYAVSCANPDACRLLVEAGADPNLRDYNGMTPIMCAIVLKINPSAEKKIFSCLLPISDVTLTDRSKSTVLHYIAKYGIIEQYKSVEKIAPLLSQQKDIVGNTPMEIIRLRNMEHSRDGGK